MKVEVNSIVFQSAQEKHLEIKMIAINKHNSKLKDCSDKLPLCAIKRTNNEHKNSYIFFNSVFYIRIYFNDFKAFEERQS